MGDYGIVLYILNTVLTSVAIHHLIEHIVLNKRLSLKYIYKYLPV